MEQDSLSHPVTPCHLKSQPEIVPDSTFGEFTNSPISSHEMVPFVDWTQPMEQWAGHNFEASMASIQPQTTLPHCLTNQVCCSFFKALEFEVCAFFFLLPPEPFQKIETSQFSQALNSFVLV